MGYEDELDSGERDEMLTKLNIWADGHQSPNQAFMALMGRSFTPIEFYDLVRRAIWNTRSDSKEDADDLAFGRGFVR